MSRRAFGAAYALFDTKLRTRLEPQRRGEATYTFLDQCAWEACDLYREAANRWIECFPQPHRSELIKRIREAQHDYEFHAFMLEVVAAATLDGFGYKITPHPTVEPLKTVPDFAILDKIGAQIAYMEVTMLAASRASLGASLRQNPVYIAIDEIVLPRGCFLNFKILTAGSNAYSPKRAKRQVQTWVDTKLISPPRQSTDRSVHIFAFEDWRIEITLYQTLSEHQYTHAIHMEGPYVGRDSTIEGVRSKLEKKAKRYGAMNLPYIVVVGDGRGRSWGQRAIVSNLSQIVFGTEQVSWDGEGSVILDRARDGLWFGRAGPRNSQISAVLFFPDVGIWGLRNELHQPLLAVNPWAKFEVPAEFKCLSRMCAEEDHYVVVPGRQIADVIGLPEHWPGNRNLPEPL